MSEETRLLPVPPAGVVGAWVEGSEGPEGTLHEKIDK